MHKVELKMRSDTPDIGNLQKCADFIHAFMLGFDVVDTVALLHLDKLYVESFKIKDVNEDPLRQAPPRGYRAALWERRQDKVCHQERNQDQDHHCRHEDPHTRFIRKH